MNWGRGLTIVILGFIAFMLGMVYISFQQTNEMIEDNYYDRELKYQQVIDAKTSLEPYKKDLILADSGTHIYLELPKELCQNISKGRLQLIRLDDAESDKVFKVSHHKNQFSRKDMKLGLYHIKLNWKNAEQAYFYEDDFYIR